MSLWTLAFQVANFLILAAVLHRFLWKPVEGMIARRQQEIEAASKDAERAKRAAEEDRVRYEQALNGVRSDREAVLAEGRTAIAAEREKALAEARVDAEAIRESARAEIAKEREDAAKELAGQAVVLAAEIAGRLLGQVASANIADAFLRQLCEHLEHLPREKLQALRDELTDSVSPVVATSPPLDTPAQALWSKRIAEDLAARGGVLFVADAALVAGAELRLPHTSISFSWRDGLTAVREELVHHDDRR